MFSIRKLARDEDGTAAILLGISLPPLMAVGALALDLGSLYLAERELQSISDAAAAAAVAEGRDGNEAEIVAAVIAESGVEDVSVVELTLGEYTRDVDLAWDQRFDPTSLYPNATRVVLTREVPLFFGSFVLDENQAQVTAQATAAKTDMAGFMLGTRVVDLPGDLANNLLSALAGTALDLTDNDVARLANVEIDVLSLAEELGPIIGMEGETFGEIFDADVPLYQVVQAMAAATDDPVLATVLGDVASRVGSDYVLLSDLIDLGPLGNSDVNDGQSGVKVDAYSLLRSVLQAAHGDSYEVTMDTNLAGLANVEGRLAGGFSEERSPWLTVDTMGDVTLRTSETRLLVTATTGSLAGLPAALEVPVYTELASAEATMADIVCAAGDGSEGVYVDVTPSLGTAAIAKVNLDMFDDFSVPLWLEPATLIDTPLVAVDAYSDIALGGEVTQQLHFTPEDVEDRLTKTVGTTDVLQGAASSLVEDVDLTVEVAGLGLGLGGYTDLVGNTLGSVAPSVDELLGQLTELLGVKVGAADVTVDRLRCGQPTIVA